MNSKARIFSVVGGMAAVAMVIWNYSFASGQGALKSRAAAVGQGESGWSVNFSALGGPISPLGPVSMGEADTLELSNLNEELGKLWRQVRPMMILGEEQGTVQDLYTEEAEALYTPNRAAASPNSSKWIRSAGSRKIPAAPSLATSRDTSPRPLPISVFSACAAFHSVAALPAKTIHARNPM